MFEDLLRDWDGEFVATRFDDPTGAWLMVGVHSTALGPGFGGTRMKPYPNPADAMNDVLRLSSAMTLKNAVAGIPFGGGKSVLAVPEVPQGDERVALIRRYADLVGSLGGSYVTACDMNTTERDMDVIGERCDYVMGRTEGAGGSGSSAPDTATGVFHAIRASLGHAFGSDDPSGRTVLVQGTGAVGSLLARRLAEAGAKVVVADLVEARVREVVDRLDGAVAATGDVYATECDVFSPCATGGVVNAETIPRLRCRIVAGAANNQLAEAADAARLADAGILYAPDYVVNAGGVLHLVGYERLGWSAEEMESRLAGIGDTLTQVFAQAEREGITTEAAAHRVADERVAVGP